MSLHRKWRSLLGVSVVAAALCGAWGCENAGRWRRGDHDRKYMLMRGPGTEITFTLPWNEIPLGQRSDVALVNVNLGSKSYHVEYGGDPTVPGSVGEGLITGGGDAWRQSKGYLYMWGYWKLLITDRSRTITWGTTVIARFLPESSDGALPEREQLFVECGSVVVIPEDGATPPVVVKEGEYVVLSGSASGGVAVTGPLPTPTGATPNSTAEELSIIEFLKHARFGHPDPCNP